MTFFYVRAQKMERVGIRHDIKADELLVIILRTEGTADNEPDNRIIYCENNKLSIEARKIRMDELLWSMEGILYCTIGMVTLKHTWMQ